ncbi:MAG: FAD/NAD(P)-binding protein, partial [Planctomycetota bacterium]
MSTKLDWLIVGGGPQGFHLTVRLLNAGVNPESIRILDPHAAPLHRWQSYTGNAGMSHLRSPQVHNLGLEALGLEDLAQSAEFQAAKSAWQEPTGENEPDFIPPYERPSLALFHEHSRALVARHGLMRSWKQGFATSMQSAETGYRISLRSGETLAPRNVVLALGSGDHLRWPAWATTLKSRHQEAPLDHIFDMCFHREHLDPSEDVVIVGAGISAAQLALSLAKSGTKRRITLLARHSLRQADFESDPGWLGPLYLAEFDAEQDLLKRRQMIDEARQLGSLAADVMQDLTRALRAGEVTHTLAHVQRAAWNGAGTPIRMDIRRMELDE